MSDEDLRRDRLYYLSPRQQPVRAARLFAGREHDVQLQRIEAHFGRSPQSNGDVARFLSGFFAEPTFRGLQPQALSGSGPFPNHPGSEWDLSNFGSAEEAYARLCLDLAVLVDYCISEVATERTRRVVIDGGFARNPWFTQILAMLQQPTSVMVAEVPQATALGAALAVHSAMQSELPPMDELLHLRRIETEALPGLRLYAEHVLAHWESASSDHEDERRTA
ncbi:MAG: FGGY-family carbohydrate kinase [candidate division KSB1 bacterium]|nr:FGGY-family carbohydrate kinase [candidate division KSB1 bacterium]